MSAAGPLTANRPERAAVVIPAKNEADRIEATVQAARTIAGVDLVVVVDDGSSDATAAIAMGAEALVVRHRHNRGKAAAMATGAQMVAMREQAELAEGGDDFDESVHAEPREEGHTGPLPRITDDPQSVPMPRALLFLDADMGASAPGAQPLVDAVLDTGVDMAVALLPPQTGASGMGIVVRTSRSGIRRATGWEATQPLSGTRCITRETWDAVQPLASGWGVETGLTIDALAAGFWVREIDCDLHHRATGRDLRGQLHRAAQLRDVVRALASRRHLSPGLPEAEERPDAPTVAELPADAEIPETPAAPEASAVPEATEAPEAPEATETPEATAVPEPAVSSAADPGDHAAVPVTDPAVSTSHLERLRILPVAGEFEGDDARVLEDADIEALDRSLRALPVEGDFAPDDIAFLSRIDLDALRAHLEQAPVQERFSPMSVVIIASHLGAPAPELPSSVRPPLSADEYTSLVVHAAVEAENREDDETPGAAGTA